MQSVLQTPLVCNPESQESRGCSCPLVLAWKTYLSVLESDSLSILRLFKLWLPANRAWAVHLQLMSCSHSVAKLLPFRSMVFLQSPALRSKLVRALMVKLIILGREQPSISHRRRGWVLLPRSTSCTCGNSGNHFFGSVWIRVRVLENHGLFSLLKDLLREHSDWWKWPLD